jgi:hypothetical protein
MWTPAPRFGAMEIEGWIAKVGAMTAADLVGDHLVDQPELERLAAVLTRGHVDVPVARRTPW